MSFGFSKAQEAELERQALARGGSITRASRFNDPWLGPIEVSEKSLKPKRAGQASRPAPTAPQGPCQSLWIPNWTPGLLNQWDGRHWSVRAKIKKADAAIVKVYFEGAGLQRTTGPRRVSIMLVLPKGKRSCDRDAVRKSTNDALVACGALFDDTPKYCLEGPVSYARAIGAESVTGTLILLEDLT